VAGEAPDQGQRQGSAGGRDGGRDGLGLGDVTQPVTEGLGGEPGVHGPLVAPGGQWQPHHEDRDRYPGAHKRGAAQRML
jgi:hypothetical protein